MKQNNTKKNTTKKNGVVRFSVSMKPETETKLLEICGIENRKKSQMIEVMILSYDKK